MPGTTISRRPSTKASMRCITCRFQRTCRRISSTSSTTRATWCTPRTHRSRCCTTVSRDSFAEPTISATEPKADPRPLILRRILEIGSQPLVNFFIEVAAVFRLGDPMPGVRPHQQAAWHMHPLQSAPVLECIIDGHAKIALPDAEQHRGLPVGRISNRTLIAPDRASLPRRAAIGEFAAVYAITGTPLGGEIDLAGMADNAPVAGGGGFDPVGQVAPVTRAGGAQPRCVNVRITLDRFIHGLIDLIAWRLQGIELDGLCKLLAETG